MKNTENLFLREETKYEKSECGCHSISDSNDILVCGETGRVIAVFYNDYDLDDVLRKLNSSM